MSSSDIRLSNAHRAILLMAKTYVSATVPAGLPELLRSAQPESLARIAQNNHIHPLIGKVLIDQSELREAIARDLYLYFRTMYEANQARSEQARSQLEQIDAAFARAKIPCVVMKGGGDLLDPLHPDPNIRFIGDLDILVPHELVDTAQATLSEIGANAVPFKASRSGAHVNQRGVAPPKHHLPKIIHSDWELPVELHFAVGRSSMDQFLPAKEVLSKAQVTTYGHLMVMSPEDRACHLIAHANHHSGELDLRSWVDWTRLRERCDLPALEARLQEHGLTDVLDVFEDMITFLKSPNETVLSRMKSEHTDAAIRRFGNSRSRKLRYLPSLFVSKAKALSNSPEYRRYIFSNLINPSWWREVYLNHWTKIRNQR